MHSKSIPFLSPCVNNDLQELEFEDSFSIDLMRHPIAKVWLVENFSSKKMNELEKDGVKKVKGMDESGLQDRCKRHL